MSGGEAAKKQFEVTNSAGEVVKSTSFHLGTQESVLVLVILATKIAIVVDMIR